MLILSNIIVTFLLFISSLFTPYTVLSETEEFIEEDNISYTQDFEEEFELEEEIVFETEKEDIKNYKGEYRVDFHFVDYDTLTDKSLPDDVMKLLEDSIYVDSIDQIKLPEYSRSESGYMFYKWEGGINLDDKQITYIGVWFKIPDTSLRSIPYPGTPADAAAGSQYPVAMGGTISGETMHQTLNGSEAICVEPDVRTYALPNTGFWHTGSISSRVAEIIWLGRNNGASWGAIQAAVWNHMYGYNKYSYGSENVDPDSSTFNSNGAYECSGPYYETQDYGGTTIIQSLTNMDEVGCRLVATNGEISVKKTAASNSIDYMSLFVNNYSLGSAKYGLYTDKECTNQIGTFTTNNNGISNSITVNTGTYYVKEIEASKGFKLDTTVYKAQVSTNNTTTIESEENPQTGKIKLNKKANDNQLLVNYSEYYSLADAKYGVYTDKNCTNKIKTITTKADGTCDVIELPIGTYYIKETKASKGFNLDENIYTATIKNNETVQISSIEIAAQGKLKLIKKTKNTDLLNNYPDNYSLQSAEYTVYTDKNCTKAIKTLITKANGHTNEIDLPTATYYIKETKASKGFKLDKNVYTAVVKDNQLTTITSNEEALTGSIKVIKKANNTYLLETYSQYYSLKDAQYSIYTDEICTTLIKTVTTDENGISNEASLPEGTYFLKETKASKGFKLDEKVYSFKIKDNDSISIESIEEAIYGEIQINKKAKDTKLDFLNDLPNNYTLKDAEYEIYTDEECLELFSSLTINEQGLSDILKLPIGTYYIKETIASKGFRLDENIYKVIVEDESFNTVESIEDPIYDPTLITLYKQNIKDKENTKYLDEVRFVLKYYDSNEETITEKDLKYTWIFKAIITNNEAEIAFDKKHYVGGDELLLDESGNLKLPLGSFTIEEMTSPQTYARDENVYYGQIIDNFGQAKIIFNDGEWIKQDKQDEIVLFMAVNNANEVFKLRQMERQIILKTTAIFEESGNDHYVADGVAHIKDTVEYDFLENGHEYILKAKLINKKDESVIMQEETIFKADDTNNTSISFKINLDNYDSSDFVVYEYLYDKDKPDVLLAKHEDINDEDQTVHVDKLYRAEMVLYKIGGSKGIRLNGAIFEVKTKRTKRDGTLVEKNLGKFISGGIFIERQDSFTFKLAMDKKMQIVIDTINSSLHPKFNSQCVTVLGLEQGIYYGQINDEEIIEYEIVKGMIKLKDQEENTEITYTELIAPAGYYMDDKPYVVNVGDDDSLTIIENYRKNTAMIIPKTGA